MPFLNGAPDELCDPAAQFTLAGDEEVAYRARTVVVLDRGGEQQAAARGLRAALEPSEPVREKGLDSGKSGFVIERRAEDSVLEKRLRLPQGLELEIFFRCEMGEEAALGESESFGKGTDGEAFQPYEAREAERFVEYKRLGLFAFAHGKIIRRTFDLLNCYMFG